MSNVLSLIKTFDTDKTGVESTFDLNEPRFKVTTHLILIKHPLSPTQNEVPPVAEDLFIDNLLAVCLQFVFFDPLCRAL